MAVSERIFLRRLTKALTKAAYRKAKPQVAKHSKTLSRALNILILTDTHGRIQIPHYWAIYLHDGRGPFGPQRARFLVWFRDPNDDPRRRKGVAPVRARQIKRLTKKQFYYWLDQNRFARQQGRAEPMIVTKYVGKPTQPTNFFLNTVGGGMHGFKDEATKTATKMAREHILKSMGDLLNIKDSATLKL